MFCFPFSGNLMMKVSASPVLERMIERARRGWDADCTVRILGASPDAVAAFLRFLYSPRW